MNLISKILLGGVVIAVAACLWFILTQKNKGGTGCSGNCAGCSELSCGKRENSNQ